MICDRKLLTASLMARRLRVPVRWLRSEAQAGRIPHVQAEKVFLFDPDSVEQTLLERARQLPKGAPVADALRAWSTPPQIAKYLGVRTDKIRHWIARGELQAVNLAETRSGRPSFPESRIA